MRYFMVGINDCPDTFTGKGKIELGKITFFEKREEKVGDKQS